MDESDPRVRFGEIIRNFRSERGLRREVFAGLVGEINRQFVECVEHGEAPRRRRILKRMLIILRMSNKEREFALRLLNQFCPRKKNRVKVHYNLAILQHRRGCLR